MPTQPMGRRCTTCTINFPLYFDQCAVCGSPLWTTYMSGPDDDWQEAVSWALQHTPEDEQPEGWKPDPEEFNADEVWNELVPHHFDNTAELYSWNELLWVKHEDLLGCDYDGLTEDSIVFLNGEFYELQGYHESSNGWWIEHIAVDASNLTPEQVIAGSQEA